MARKGLCKNNLLVSPCYDTPWPALPYIDESIDSSASGALAMAHLATARTDVVIFAQTLAYDIPSVTSILRPCHVHKF